MLLKKGYSDETVEKSQRSVPILEQNPNTEMVLLDTIKTASNTQKRTEKVGLNKWKKSSLGLFRQDTITRKYVFPLKN